MGSQALGSPAEAESSIGSSAPLPVRRAPRRPRPPVLAALFAAAWAVPVLTQLTRTAPLLVLLIVFGTGGLLRVGATVVDRLFITVALLTGLAIVAGLLFSVWPFGLQPIAVGGLALTLLVAAYWWTGAAPPWRSWPRRMLGSDAILGLGLISGFLVAYWPSFSTLAGSKLGFAGMTGDRLRHFSLFDTIHTAGGYTFLMQGKVKNAVDPSMLAVYPPGQHYLYALGDIFLRSRVDPGNAVDELLRYNVWVSLGYGFLVASVAWAARWAAGPVLAGWRRALLTSAIVGFLTVGAFTSAIWCTWDPQVLAMAQLALLAAFCFRPPRGWRTHAALMALLFIAICLTYELYAPFGAILIAVSLFQYRKRLLPHWKPLLALTIVSIPAALSEYIAAHHAGLSGASASKAIGFTIPLSWAVLTVLGCVSVLGFADRAARRRPSAVAGLIAVLLSALAVLALMLYMDDTIGAVSYYFQKFVQAWAVIMMVAAGSFGHLLRRPKPPMVGWKGFGVGLCAFLLAIGLTRSFWWSSELNRVAVPASDPNPGASWSLGSGASWAGVWISGGNIVPNNIAPLGILEDRHLLANGVPTITVVFQDSGSNVNLSLQLSVLNRNAGVMGAVEYGSSTDQYRGLNSSEGLVCAGQDGAAWTRQQLTNLREFEDGIKAVGVPVRVIVVTQPLQTALEQWSAQNPGAIKDVLYIPSLSPGTCPSA